MMRKAILTFALLGFALAAASKSIDEPALGGEWPLDYFALPGTHVSSMYFPANTWGCYRQLGSGVICY